MNIVVLDGYALNPGDLDWSPLQALGLCRIHDRTENKRIIERSGDADILLTNKTPLAKETLDHLPRLRFIGVLATGHDGVDGTAAAALGIPVTNVPAYGTESVAQMVFAHLLNLATRAGDSARGVGAGRWTASADWSYWDFPQREIQGLTMGIIGYGRIGRATARIARGFGMRVLAVDRDRLEDADGVEAASLEDLLRRSDVISLHCPLTDQTRGIINPQTLRLLKPTAFLINTSRGALIDENALAEALTERRLAGAGLDVLSMEPPPAGHPLLRAPNCFITPHIAWATLAARQRLLDEVVENVRAFLAGRGRNIVNGVTHFRRG